MPDPFPRKSFVEVARRWLVLAEKHHAHLVELAESGRWQRYYSAAQLLELIRDAAVLEEKWAKLAYPDGGRPERHPAMERAKLPKPASIAEPAMIELRTRLDRFRRAG